MHYQDFIIKIEAKRGDDYLISVESPAGEGSSTLKLPFELDAAADIMRNLAGTFRGSAGTESAEHATREVSWSRGKSAPKIDLPKALFDSLFSGTARSLFDQSLGMVRGGDSGLRIKLQIDPTNADVAALAGLPWELLYREETRDYLNLSHSTPLVRYLNVQRPFAPQSFKPPLRILVVMSSPQGVPQLKLDQERTLIEESWARQGGVEVDFLERPATTQRLSNKLSEKDYHVLHYMGHGDFDKASGHGVLLLEDDNYQPVPLDGQTLGGVILHDVKSLRLVFLNACDTAKATKTEGQDPFAGVATAMIMAGIPAVVAMQFPITDKAAIQFAGTFYPRIVSGYPVDAAVAEGRKAIRLADSSSMEWATPVLFMRSPDGVLFDVADATPTPPPQPETALELQPVPHVPGDDVGGTPPGGLSTAVKAIIGVGAAGLLAVIAWFFLAAGKPVPDISAYNFEVAGATAFLKDNGGLKVAETTEGIASALPKGRVIRTNPAAGNNVRRGNPVKLIISNGMIELENLMGKTETEVKSLLDSLPIAVGSIVREVNSAPVGTVLRTEPAAGQIIPHDSAVTLYVAAEGTEIPDISGQGMIEAMASLNRAGLQAELKYELNMDGKPGKVIGTNPVAGTSHIPNEPVTVLVSARGGWVYIGSQVPEGDYTSPSARTLRAAAHNQGAQLGVVKKSETVTVLESQSSGWARVQAKDP